MGDSKDILTVLLLSGLMGMVGQGARTVVGLKKLSDWTSTTPGQSDVFDASRVFVGLMIGFVAGVAAGLSMGIKTDTAMDTSVLMGLSASGYLGCDVIEGFTQSIRKGPDPSVLSDNSGANRGLPPEGHG